MVNLVSKGRSIHWKNILLYVLYNPIFKNKHFFIENLSTANCVILSKCFSSRIKEHCSSAVFCRGLGELVTYSARRMVSHVITKTVPMFIAVKDRVTRCTGAAPWNVFGRLWHWGKHFPSDFNLIWTVFGLFMIWWWQSEICAASPDRHIVAYFIDLPKIQP